MKKAYLLAAATACISTAPALAQQSLYRVNLPGQSLSKSLYDVSHLTGLQVIFAEGAITQVAARPLTGSFTAQQMLEHLLQSSGYAFAISGNVVRVYRAPPVAKKINTAVPAEPAAAEAVPPSVPAASDTADIVVTAQGRTEALQRVPLSVSVTTGEALQKAAIVSLDQLSTHVSGVKITNAPAANLLNMRGVGSGLNVGFEQSVGTFVDGVYRGRARAIQSALFDVERVEILKGPQTTFFGNNTIAGAFNITTRKPGDEFSYNASALYGSYNQYAVEAGASLPITDTLSVRVAGRAYGQDGFVRNDYTGEHGPHQRDWIGRASVEWRPTADLTSHLRVDRGRLRDTDNFPSELIHCPPTGMAAAGLCARYLAQGGGSVDDTLNLRRAGHPSHFDYDFVEIAWNNELHLGEYTLTANTGYFDHDSNSAIDPWPIPVTGAGGGPTLIPIVNVEKYHNFSQEARLISPADRTVSFLIGAYYSRGNLDNMLYVGQYFVPFGAMLAPAFSPADRVTIASDFDQKDRVLSAFGAATLNISESVRVNGGLRYSVVKKRAARTYFYGTVAADPFPSADNFIPGNAAQQAAGHAFFGSSAANFPDPTRTEKKLMPTVSVQYDLARDVMAYLSYSEGFKAGGFPVGDTPNPFGPETVKAYEAGLKGSFFDRRLSLNIAAFWSDYSGLQETANVTQPNGTNLQFVANVGKLRSRGVEIGGTWRVSDNLRFRSEVAYLDAKYRSFPNGPCTVLQSLAVPNCVQDLGGKRRPFAPEWSGSAGITYDMPIGDNMLSLEPSVRFSSKFYQLANADPLLVQPGYAKIDARLAYAPDDRRWEIAIIGTNLTKKLTGSFRNNIGSSPGTIYALPEESRSVAVQLSFRR